MGLRVERAYSCLQLAQTWRLSEWKDPLDINIA